MDRRRITSSSSGGGGSGGISRLLMTPAEPWRVGDGRVGAPTTAAPSRFQLALLVRPGANYIAIMPFPHSSRPPPRPILPPFSPPRPRPLWLLCSFTLWSLELPQIFPSSSLTLQFPRMKVVRTIIPPLISFAQTNTLRRPEPEINIQHVTCNVSHAYYSGR